MWLLGTIIILLSALVPLFALVAAGKSFFGEEIDFAAFIAFASSVSSILFHKGKDTASALSRLMGRISSLALYLEKVFSDLSFNIERLFAPEHDHFVRRESDEPINVSQYRSGFPKSVALAICCVFMVGASVIYITANTPPVGGGSSFVTQSVQPAQEVNKAKKADRIDLATKFEDRFSIDADGCGACGGPELIPLPSRRPHFYPVPRPRPAKVE